MTTDNNNTEPVPDEPAPLLCHVCEEAVAESWDYVHPTSERGLALRAFNLARLSVGGENGEPFRPTVDALIAEDRAIVMCEACHDDHYRCVDCSTFIDSADANYFDDEPYCSSCYYDNVFECDDCSSLYHADTGCQNEHYHDDDDEVDGIHSYSYRPAPVFYIRKHEVIVREPRRVAVTGFELETEAVNCEVYEAVEVANDIFGASCYLKHDGSLNNGFEIVSHPMTREYIQNVFPFDDVKRLAQLGMRSAQTDSCGLHVHINKGFFKGRETSFYRFLSMFHNNETQWKRLAGRNNSGYARWGEDEDKRMLTYTKGLNRAYNFNSINGNRYVAINLQPSHTVELRFFKGTLRPATLKARIEAVHAVAEYSVATRNNVNIKASNDWDKFREFALANNFLAFSEYAELKGV